MSETPAPTRDPRLAHALELLTEAEKLTVPGDVSSLGRAVANAEAAIKVIGAFVAATPTPEARNMLAGAWTRRGIVLLLLGSAESLPESVRCFDEALRLRHDLLATRHPALVFAQATCFLHRGDALSRLTGETQARQAIASYGDAITLLRSLPFGEAPQVLGRLVVALSNRGIVFESLRTSDGVRDAIQSYREIVSLIRGTPFEQHPEFSLHLGAAYTNLANMLLNPAGPQPDAAEARAAAGAAVQAVSALAREHVMAGEIAIKASRGICRAISAILEAKGEGAPAPREFLNEMTDAADEALSVARFWESKGVNHFRGLAIEMFGFGATLYVQHQVHFFAEFVLDNLDPEQSPDAFQNCPQMHGLATALIADALRHFERDRMVTADTKNVDRQIETMQALRHASERLTALKPEASKRSS
jgi:hypothetical protein